MAFPTLRNNSIINRINGFLTSPVYIMILSALCQMFPLLFFHGQSPWALWTTALVQTVWGIPFIFPSYYICKMMPRKPIDKAPSPY